jgi:segregation and condensation protein A
VTTRGAATDPRPATRQLVAVGPGPFVDRLDPEVAPHAAIGEAGAAAVRISVGRRPEGATTIRLGPFEGPLALLVALIEQQELDIRTVPLGDLAGAYLEALAGLPDERIPHLSAFVTVAAQLILIKSRALLPEPVPPEPLDADPDAGDPAEELRRRLIEYRAFRDAGRLLALRLEGGMALVAREPRVALAAAHAGTTEEAGPALEPTLLRQALERLARIAPPPEPLPETLRRTVTLAERAAVIRAALAQAPVIVLQELLRGVRDRVVVAVTFLALLELGKRRELTIEQEMPWGPIVCRRADEAE